MAYSQYSQNPYQQQDQGYGQNQYEMQNYNQAPAASSSTTPLSVQDFLNQVQSIRDSIGGLSQDIASVERLHQRTLGSTDPHAAAELEQHVAQTQSRNRVIKDDIKRLELDLAATKDSSRTVKKTQFDSLKVQFEQELRRFSSVESEYRQRYREQIGRQYRIVNPSASEDEVQQAMEADWGNEGVFQTALRSNRTGQASSVLGNVRARHNEIQRIENTLAELSQLFTELAAVVELQEPVVQQAENNAIETTNNLEKGLEQTEKAKEHAARARRLKWWCALVVFLIVLVVALGVGLGVGLAAQN